jgi:hypothetical protein
VIGGENDIKPRFGEHMRVHACRGGCGEKTSQGQSDWNKFAFQSHGLARFPRLPQFAEGYQKAGEIGTARR